MKKEHLKLAKQEEEHLEALLSKGGIRESTRKRAMGLLELHKGRTFIEVQKLLKVSYPTVLSWARKYKSEGLAILEDKARAGRPIGISGEERAKIAALAGSPPPEGHSRWSLRLLSAKVVELGIVDSISFKQVGNILKKMDLSLTVKGNPE